MLTQGLIPELAIEAFNIAILGRLSGLYQLQFNPILIGLLVPCFTRELRPLVGSDRCGIAPECSDAIERSGYLITRNAEDYRAVGLYPDRHSLQCRAII